MLVEVSAVVELVFKNAPELTTVLDNGLLVIEAKVEEDSSVFEEIGLLSFISVVVILVAEDVVGTDIVVVVVVTVVVVVVVVVVDTVLEVSVENDIEFIGLTVADTVTVFVGLMVEDLEIDFVTVFSVVVDFVDFRVD